MTRHPFDPALAKAVFQTNEVSIDPEALADALRSRLAADEDVRVFTSTNVLSVAKDDRGIIVESADANGHHRERYDYAVNALWEGRLAIDATFGLAPPRPWSFRVKRYLRLSTEFGAAQIPSATIVLGPVRRCGKLENGDLCLSWYPVGREVFSTTLVPPEFLPPNLAQARELRRGTMAGLSAILPGLRSLDPGEEDRAEVKGGIIVAWGNTDIDDLRSNLHERYAIGPHSVGAYHSIDTGKLTTAPFFAKVVADRIRDSI